MIVGQDKPDLVHFGVKGMKWGVRKEYTRDDLTDDLSTLQYRRRRLGIEKREYKQAEARRKQVKKETGVDHWKAYKGSTRSNNGLLIKKKYTDDEILDARRVQLGRQAVVRAFEKPITNVSAKEYRKNAQGLNDSVENVVANFKTTGERRTATLLLGPVGAYRFGNTRSQVVRRASARNTKYGMV